jgi:preprotein translocase subunit SecG
MLHSIVLGVHLIVAIMIVGLVLLQRGKGAEAGTGFGAGASGTVFGARGSANFLSRATGVLATVFFITSLALAYLSTQRTAPSSLLDAPAQTAPASQEPPTSEPSGATTSPPAATQAPPAATQAPPAATDLPQLPNDAAPAPAGDAPPARQDSGGGNAPR